MYIYIVKFIIEVVTRINVYFISDIVLWILVIFWIKEFMDVIFNLCRCNLFFNSFNIERYNVRFYNIYKNRSGIIFVFKDIIVYWS